MSNVRWKTALHIFGSAISIILAIAGAYFGLKGDIKDGRVEAKEQLSAAVTSINHKIDTTQQRNDLQFQALWGAIANLKSANPQNTTYITQPKKDRTSFYIEKYVDGQLVFVPLSKATK